MMRIVELKVEDTVPDGQAVLGALGVPPDRDPGDAVVSVLEEALAEFGRLAGPMGITKHVSTDEFARVYDGQGDNESPSPLEEIFPRAERLTLFAVTLGPALSSRVPVLFDEGRLALGTTLDAAASEGAELAADRLERVVMTDLLSESLIETSWRTLRYSPGYCGWNMTGQRALFAALRPEEIGIELLDSCLMEPVKSISGVMVTGAPEIHEFDNTYAFCSQCTTKACRARIRSLREPAE